MKPIEVLDFVVRHTAYRSTKAIASIAETDPANLYSCLSGKRAMPQHTAAKVAAAVGLKALHSQDAMTLSIDDGITITLKFGTNELTQFSELVKALSPNSQYAWTAIPGDADVIFILIAAIGESYLIGLVSSDNTEEELNIIAGGFERFFNQKKVTCNESTIRNIELDYFLTRLKSGILGNGTLDILFQKNVTAKISDWAKLLIALEKMGLDPNRLQSKLHLLDDATKF